MVGYRGFRSVGLSTQNYWSLSAYSTELWAVLFACCKAGCIYTATARRLSSNQSLFLLAHQLIQRGTAGNGGVS